MRPGQSASISTATLWSLLDDDERADLLAGMTDASEAKSDPLEVLGKWSAAEVLARIVAIRGPFIRMLHEFCNVLTRLEASVRGNIRFVILPQGLDELSVEFGTQLRSVVATIVNSRWLQDGQVDICERIEALSLQARRVHNGTKPRNVDRLTSQGHILQELGDRMPGPDGFRYRWMAQNRMTHSSLEYHPIDAQRLREIHDRMSRLNRLYKRLTKEQPTIALSEAWRECYQVEKLMHRKADEAAALVSSEYPNPPRSNRDLEYIELERRITAVEEALLAVANFEQATGDIFDFMNLELWRQRWRVYELWVLARITNILTSLGAQISSNGRIRDGRWLLKYTKDRKPVLTFKLATIEFELFYQLFDAGMNSNDMPDLALRMRDDQYVVVADPKHGKTYSRAELAHVCERYSDHFRAELTCVVNYFPASAEAEELPGSYRKLLLWGLQPGNDVALRFDGEVNAAIRAVWVRNGFPKPSILALFDVSGSTAGYRQRLQECFIATARSVFPQSAPASQVAFFGRTVIAQASFDDALSGRIDFGITSDSTNLDGAFEWALNKLESIPGERQLWLFTDGKANFQLDRVSRQIAEEGIRITVFEFAQTSSLPTPLQRLCEITGGVHRRIVQ